MKKLILFIFLSVFLLAGMAVAGPTVHRDGGTILKTLVTAQGTPVAGANDMTLGDGNFFDITGATTINTIASKGIGTFIVLQFDAALQLTHSNDLFLPTAANITTAAGDIAVFYEYASADWRCVVYTRADGTVLVESDTLDTVTGRGATTTNAIEIGGLTVRGLTGAVAILNLIADAGEDNSDKWKVEVADGGDVTLESYQSGAWVAVLTVDNTGNIAATSFTAANMVVSTKTDDYVVTASDFGKSLRMNHGSAKNFTLPSVGAAEDGARLTFIKQGAGRMTMTAVDSDTVHDSSAAGTLYTETLYATITLEYVHGMTRWVIIAATGTLTTT